MNACPSKLAPCFWAFVGGVLALLSAGSALATEAQLFGRALFETGVYGADGSMRQLSARAGGDAAWVMRGRSVACANCHGINGEGGGEGFQRAPSLRWPEWSSTDPALRAAARERLRLAVLDGRRADGQRLSQAMPRFDLDEETIEAITAYTERLVIGRVAVSLPTLALLRLGGKQAPAQERVLHQRLEACLSKRVGDRVRLLIQDVADGEAAQRMWGQWQSQPEVLAVLAPPWRGWRPPIESEGGKAALSALFPLVADPDTGHSAAVWLFGGTQARVAALVQAWLLNTDRPAGESLLPVWVGDDAQAEHRWRSVEAVAGPVSADTGQRPRFVRMATPKGSSSHPALWLDPERLPGAGWWLVPQPVAAQPSPGGRWWMAQPYAGSAQRPLALRWADAACKTVESALGQGPSSSRGDWAAQLASLGRLNDGDGWSWQVLSPDPDGLGAVSAWSVVAFESGGDPRLVNPRVDLSRPLIRKHQRSADSATY